MWKMSDSAHCQMPLSWGNHEAARLVFGPRPIIRAAFGRHRASVQSITGVYSREIQNDAIFYFSIILTG